MYTHVHRNNFKQVHSSERFFDEGPEEPELCTLRGYDDCENCYFRLTAVKRITDSVRQLQEA